MENANELRLYAAEIIRKLWEGGELGQLELLQSQVNASIDLLKKEVDIEKALVETPRKRFVCSWCFDFVEECGHTEKENFYID